MRKGWVCERKSERKSRNQFCVMSRYDFTICSLTGTVSNQRFGPLHENSHEPRYRPRIKQHMSRVVSSARLLQACCKVEAADIFNHGAEQQ